MANEIVTGLAELQKQLDMLAPNIEKKLLRGALRAGQLVTAQIAKDKVPVAQPSAENARLYGSQPGSLRDSIRVSTSARGSRVVAKLKAGSKAAFYAHFVEFGTLAHVINGPLSLGGKVYAKLDHPGAKAQPFMRPALDWAASGESESFKAVGAYLAQRITKELSKLPDETDTRA